MALDSVLNIEENHYIKLNSKRLRGQSEIDDLRNEQKYMNLNNATFINFKKVFTLSG